MPNWARNEFVEKEMSSNKSSANPMRTVLGIDQDITRRDFLNATLLASGGALLHSSSPAHHACSNKRRELPESTTGPATAA